ncbi:MAG: hypothetical protein QXO15_06355 [Nitrososphaerota archaeon]
MAFIIEIDILDLFKQLYFYLRDLIRWFLENTLFRANQRLSEQFADPIILLCGLTALLLMIEFISSVKKILLAIVIIGWTMLIVSMILAILM